jgi:four helix bundle protein
MGSGKSPATPAGAIHENLLAWRLAVDLAVDVVQVTRSFPPEERFGLAAQMRRAAYSVPCNIAEGNGPSTRRAFAHCVAIARGSLNELRTQLVIASRCGWITDDVHVRLRQQAIRTSQLLNALYRSLTVRRKGTTR